MDTDGSPSKPSSRKVRFAPKGPPPRRKLAVAPKTEEETDERDEEAAKALFRKVNERRGRREPKASLQVAFGGRSETSTSLRQWGMPKEGSISKAEDLVLQDSARGNKQTTVSSFSTSVADETIGGPVVRVDTSNQKLEKDYIEPWDYNHSFYPVTLPLRRPYSGDPEILDQAEFGEGGATEEYDEDLTNSAAELGLLTEKKDVQMLFFQLPPSLPLVRSRPGADAAVDNSKISKSDSGLGIGREQETGKSLTPLRGPDALAKAKGKEKVDQGATGISPASRGMEIVGKSMLSRKKNEHLEDLPAGYMGKMLVYKSGAIKLKLGNILYDVSAGSSCIFAQDVAAINTVDKECCVLGEIGKRAIVTPDQSLYDNVIDLT